MLLNIKKTHVKFDNVCLYIDKYNTGNTISEQNKILKNINFTIYQGEYVAIIGKNGCGKSSIIKLLCGFFYPTSGNIIINNNINYNAQRNMFAYTNITDTDILSKYKIGVVFENPNIQMISHIGANNLINQLENLCVPENIIKEQFEYITKLLNLNSFMYKETTDLSGGQKQKLAIATTLIQNPSLLLLDEITAMLDNNNKAQILDIIDNYNKQYNATVISITHDYEEILKADKIIIIDNGEIYAIGSPKEIFADNEYIIKDIGLQLPTTIQISKILKDNNLIEDYIFDKIELKDTICKLI